MNNLVAHITSSLPKIQFATEAAKCDEASLGTRTISWLTITRNDHIANKRFVIIICNERKLNLLPKACINLRNNEYLL